MRIPKSLISITIFFAMLLSILSRNQGIVYLGLSILLLFLLIFYLSYQRFGKLNEYWFLPLTLSFVVILMGYYLGREVIQIFFFLISTGVIIFSYDIQEKIFKGDVKNNLDYYSRISHYFSVALLFTTFYSISFYSINNLDRNNFYFDILNWLVRVGVFIFLWLLTYSILKTSVKKDSIDKKKANFYSFSISFFFLEIFWGMSFLPLRYNVLGITVFFLYFITIEWIRLRIGCLRNKKIFILYLFLAIVGILTMLLTAKWGY